MREYTENGNELEHGKNSELRETEIKIVVHLWGVGEYGSNAYIHCFEQEN